MSANLNHKETIMNACCDFSAHGFFNFGRGDGQEFKATVRVMDEFLGALEYLKGKPNRVIQFSAE